MPTDSSTLHPNTPGWARFMVDPSNGDRDGERVNLGCGRNPPPGFQNVDYKPAPHVDTLADLNDYPWPWDDNRWSVVRSHNLLEHLTNPARALKEMHRVTKPGGILDLMVPHRDSPAACQIDHTWLYDQHSLVPNYRGGKGTPGLDVPHLFDLISLNVTHIHPFAWHQRHYLGRELIAWGPKEIRWILVARP